MELYDVLSRKEFVHNGKAMSTWHRIGKLKMNPNGGKYLQLFQWPQNEYYVVERQEDKNLEADSQPED